MVLRELVDADEAAFEIMLDAWDGAPGFTLAYGLLEDMNFKSYLKMLEDSKTDMNLPQGHVPSTALFAFVGEEIVGKVNLRHRLNHDLELSGGHIGYGVMPIHRGKGLATEMLKQALVYCRGLGLRKILLTCDEANISSSWVIQKNGGVLENVDDPKNGSSKKLRYWIEL